VKIGTQVSSAKINVRANFDLFASQETVRHRRTGKICNAACRDGRRLRNLEEGRWADGCVCSNKRLLNGARRGVPRLAID